MTKKKIEYLAIILALVLGSCMLFTIIMRSSNILAIILFILSTSFIFIMIADYIRLSIKDKKNK